MGTSLHIMFKVSITRMCFFLFSHLPLLFGTILLFSSLLLLFGTVGRFKIIENSYTFRYVQILIHAESEPMPLQVQSIQRLDQLDAIMVQHR